MSRMSNACRRMAVRMARHATWVLPGGRPDWAAAMRSELDYIADDRAALRWALGCVSASYAARLVALARSCGRAVLRPVLAMGTLLFIALALGHASDQARSAPPVSQETSCQRPDTPADNGAAAGIVLRHEPSEGRSGTPEDRSQSIDRSCQPAHQP
jgi:hypothetical protein